MKYKKKQQKKTNSSNCERTNEFLCYPENDTRTHSPHKTFLVSCVVAFLLSLFFIIFFFLFHFFAFFNLFFFRLREPNALIRIDVRVERKKKLTKKKKYPIFNYFNWLKLTIEHEKKYKIAKFHRFFSVVTARRTDFLFRSVYTFFFSSLIFVSKHTQNANRFRSV